MKRLRIYIDRGLREKFGPEICWTWRTLLTGMGFIWEESLHPDSHCDVAYVSDVRGLPDVKVIIQADPYRWDNRKSLKFEGLGDREDFPCLVFSGENHGSQLFSLNQGGLVCNKDIIFDVFWLVTGQAERTWQKDKHGFFDLSASPQYRDRIMRGAVASQIGLWLDKRIQGQVSLEKVPRWPGGKKAAAALSHDVDYPIVRRFIEPFRLFLTNGPSKLPFGFKILLGEKNYWHFADWIEKEKKSQVRSVFYFAAQKGSLVKYFLGCPDPFYEISDPRFQQLFGELADNGFEIGLHASYRAHESLEKFAREKDLLVEFSRQKIAGCRHHYWHLSPSDPEATLLMHEKIGFKYDCSISHERYLGFRRGLSWPFFPFHQRDRREINTLQISTAWMDDQLFSWKEDNPGGPVEQLQQLADKTLQQGGCFIVDVHDYVYDDGIFNHRLELYLWLLEYITHPSEYWVAIPADIAAHWTDRYRQMIKNSRGLMDGFFRQTGSWETPLAAHGGREAEGLK